MCSACTAQEGGAGQAADCSQLALRRSAEWGPTTCWCSHAGTMPLSDETKHVLLCRAACASRPACTRRCSLLTCSRPLRDLLTAGCEMLSARAADVTLPVRATVSSAASCESVKGSLSSGRERADSSTLSALRGLPPTQWAAGSRMARCTLSHMLSLGSRHPADTGGQGRGPA